MTVKAILERKGHNVLTVGPDETLAEAVRILAEHRIGALVITDGDRKIVGILSERDIVRVIAKEGADALVQPVSHAMTAKVKSCSENHSVNEVMEIMTVGRFRHLPVEKNGRARRHHLDRRRRQAAHRGCRARSRRDQAVHRHGLSAHKAAARPPCRSGASRKGRGALLEIPIRPRRRAAGARSGRHCGSIPAALSVSLIPIRGPAQPP